LALARSLRTGLLRILVVGVLAGTGLGALAVSAKADAPRNGYGFGIADDGGPATLNTQFFDRLRPKTFRFMVPWYAALRPDQIARADQIIYTARAHGVEQIAVSFNEGDSEDAPDVATYRSLVDAFLRHYAGVVDAWGPANEPNCGGGWTGLNGTTGGAQLTAEYYKTVLFIIRSGVDPTATMLSPDFCDSFPGNSVGPWMTAYKNAGGGFGDVIAWHPYWDVHYRGAARVGGVSSTQDLINNVNGKPIWVTEVGAFGVNTGHGINDSEMTQNQKVQWIAGTLAHNNRITRIHYYSMYGDATKFDTGLLRSDGNSTRRPSWYTWCVETHGGAAFDPDCIG
jgi:hypothetical protein